MYIVYIEEKNTVSRGVSFSRRGCETFSSWSSLPLIEGTTVCAGQPVRRIMRTTLYPETRSNGTIFDAMSLWKKEKRKITKKNNNTHIQENKEER